MIALDHIAVAARTLEEGSTWLAERLGVAPEPGGAHPMMGTHNRLLSLGPGEYLELIAVDPEAPRPSHARWFGLDAFDGPPRVVGWVARTDRITALPGTQVQAARRGDLRWRITVADRGVMPAGGTVPALIDWQDSPHPATRLTDHGLRLGALRLSHPTRPDLPLADPRVTFEVGPTALAARIDGPAGAVLL